MITREQFIKMVYSKTKGRCLYCGSTFSTKYPKKDVLLEIGNIRNQIQELEME